MTARKYDTPAVVQAAIGNEAGVGSISDDGGLIQTEVGAFYWTAKAPKIANSGREEQVSVSV